MRKEDHRRFVQHRHFQERHARLKVALTHFPYRQLVFKALGLAGAQGLADAVYQPLGQLRWQYLAHQLALESGRFSIEQLRLGSEDFHVAAVFIQHQEDIGNGVDDSAQARFACSQSCFYRFALGDLLLQSGEELSILLLPLP